MATKDKIIELLSDDHFEGLDELISMGNEAIPFLIDIVKEDENPMYRSRASITLGRMNASESSQTLADAISDEHEVVSIWAIDALAKMDSKDCATYIAEKLNETKDISLKMKCIQALGSLEVEETMKYLEVELETAEGDMHVQEAALLTLNKIQNKYLPEIHNEDDPEDQ